MERFKGLILLYSILGIVFVAIVAALLIPERVQLAAEPIASSTPVPTSIVGDTDYVAAVSQHMVLPTETPKVVPVLDAEKLKKEQPFFANAENGDQLLIYSSKVILYSPTLDRIVEIAQIRN